MDKSQHEKDDHVKKNPYTGSRLLLEPTECSRLCNNPHEKSLIGIFNSGAENINNKHISSMKG